MKTKKEIKDLLGMYELLSKDISSSLGHRSSEHIDSLIRFIKWVLDES